MSNKMITNDITSLVDKYTNWFRKELTVNNLKDSEYTVIHTPFLDAFSDNISVYALMKGDDIVLSDDKNTSISLELSNVNITPKRSEQIKYLLRKHSVEMNEESEIVKKTKKNNFSRDLHSLISAIIDIGSLYLTSQDRTVSFFKDDVLNYLDNKKIFYTENVSFVGTSNFVHTYDMVFQKNENNPERLSNVLESINKGKLAELIFSWNDTKNSRNKDSKLIIFLNNQEKEIDNKYIEALENYDIIPLLWKEKEHYLDFLK